MAPLKSVLLLSPVAVEAKSSAAGVRTFGLLQHFADMGCQVGFGTGVKSSSNAKVPSGVLHYRVRYNNSEDVVKVMGELDPDLVIFDRFVAEEAFSSRVRELSPSAIRVLDMQDMHSLRRHRETIPFPSIPSPSTSSSLVRELASLHRSDLSIVCSSVEKAMLENEYKIPGEKLQLGSFFTKPVEMGYDEEKHGYDHRKNFISIGGFKHKPNVDSAVWLAEEIWPRINKKIPDASLNIYGAYPTKQISSLHSPKNNIRVHGFVPSLDEPFLKNRVLLAPLRFGAGVKGKIIDAFRYGCPVVTTPIGSEGIGPDVEWGGLVTRRIDDAEEFADAAVALYNDRKRYESSKAAARKILVSEFDETTNLDAIVDSIERVNRDLEGHRQRDVFGNVLWHSSNRATEFFSRFIELKEKNRKDEENRSEEPKCC